MNNEVNVLALVKGQERYVFMYNDQNREEIVESFGRYASDPDLSFTWLDAATLTQKALREKRESELRAARYRFLAVRERVVSSGDASWRSLFEKELMRALARPRRAAR